MRIASGIKLLAETEGSGAVAKRDDWVEFECATRLWTGEVVGGRVKQRTRVGSRQVVAGVEKTLLGMREGGYRRVRVSPHLAYGAQGVVGKVPPNAALDFELWVVHVIGPSLAVPPPGAAP
jgi:FKBP-type peptidyl-prolyl cis-trans isomerase